MENTPGFGKPIWFDLTVPNASQVRDFYQQVMGWTTQNIPMGNYDDYAMLPAGEEKGVAGICHKEGENAVLPSQWMIYFSVPDLKASLEAVTQHGGEVLVPPRGHPGFEFAVIRDPGGAVCALMQTPSANSNPTE